MTTTFTIKQASEQLGISPHTLRYYEREGLFGTAVARNTSGHREYSEQNLLWFKLLLCLRQTDMPLEQVKVFAEMSRQGSSSVAERYDMLLKHRTSLKNHIETLRRMLEMLNEKVARYKILLADETAAKALEDQLLKD